MKIIFMGTPDFAVPTLKKLYDSGYEVQAVFTQPDKPKGRGYKLTPPLIVSWGRLMAKCSLSRCLIYQDLAV